MSRLISDRMPDTFRSDGGHQRFHRRLDRSWVGVAELLLIKSVGGPEEISSMDALQRGWIDSHFPICTPVFLENGCQVSWINARGDSENGWGFAFRPLRVQTIKPSEPNSLSVNLRDHFSLLHDSLWKGISQVTASINMIAQAC